MKPLAIVAVIFASLFGIVFVLLVLGQMASPAIGRSEAVVKASPYLWPCGSTPDALDQMMRATLKGGGDVRSIMRETRSIGLVGGMHVEVIEKGYGIPDFFFFVFNPLGSHLASDRRIPIDTGILGAL